MPLRQTPKKPFLQPRSQKPTDSEQSSTFFLTPTTDGQPTSQKKLLSAFTFMQTSQAVATEPQPQQRPSGEICSHFVSQDSKPQQDLPLEGEAEISSHKSKNSSQILTKVGDKHYELISQTSQKRAMYEEPLDQALLLDDVQNLEDKVNFSDPNDASGRISTQCDLDTAPQDYCDTAPNFRSITHPLPPPTIKNGSEKTEKHIVYYVPNSTDYRPSLSSINYSSPSSPKGGELNAKYSPFGGEEGQNLPADLEDDKNETGGTSICLLTTPQLKADTPRSSSREESAACTINIQNGKKTHEEDMDSFKKSVGNSTLMNQEEDNKMKQECESYPSRQMVFFQEKNTSSNSMDSNTKKKQDLYNGKRAQWMVREDASTRRFPISRQGNPSPGSAPSQHVQPTSKISHTIFNNKRTSLGRIINFRKPVQSLVSEVAWAIGASARRMQPRSHQNRVATARPQVASTKQQEVIKKKTLGSGIMNIKEGCSSAKTRAARLQAEGGEDQLKEAKNKGTVMQNSKKSLLGIIAQLTMATHNQITENNELKEKLEDLMTVKTILQCSPQPDKNKSHVSQSPTQPKGIQCIAPKTLDTAKLAPMETKSHSSYDDDCRQSKLAQQDDLHQTGKNSNRIYGFERYLTSSMKTYVEQHNLHDIKALRRSLSRPRDRQKHFSLYISRKPINQRSTTSNTNVVCFNQRSKSSVSHNSLTKSFADKKMDLVSSDLRSSVVSKEQLLGTDQDNNNVATKKNQTTQSQGEQDFDSITHINCNGAGRVKKVDPDFWQQIELVASSSHLDAKKDTKNDIPNRKAHEKLIKPQVQYSLTHLNEKISHNNCLEGASSGNDLTDESPLGLKSSKLGAMDLSSNVKSQFTLNAAEKDGLTQESQINMPVKIVTHAKKSSNSTLNFSRRSARFKDSSSCNSKDQQTDRSTDFYGLLIQSRELPSQESDDPQADRKRPRSSLQHGANNYGGGGEGSLQDTMHQSATCSVQNTIRRGWMKRRIAHREALLSSQNAKDDSEKRERQGHSQFGQPAPIQVLYDQIEGDLQTQKLHSAIQRRMDNDSTKISLKQKLYQMKDQVRSQSSDSQGTESLKVNKSKLRGTPKSQKPQPQQRRNITAQPQQSPEKLDRVAEFITPSGVVMHLCVGQSMLKTEDSDSVGDRARHAFHSTRRSPHENDESKEILQEIQHFEDYKSKIIIKQKSQNNGIFGTKFSLTRPQTPQQQNRTGRQTQQQFIPLVSKEIKIKRVNDYSIDQARLKSKRPTSTGQLAAAAQGSLTQNFSSTGTSFLCQSEREQLCSANLNNSSKHGSTDLSLLLRGEKVPLKAQSACLAKNTRAQTKNDTKRKISSFKIICAQQTTTTAKQDIPFVYKSNSLEANEDFEVTYNTTEQRAGNFTASLEEPIISQIEIKRALQAIS